MNALLIGPHMTYENDMTVEQQAKKKQNKKNDAKQQV